MKEGQVPGARTLIENIMSDGEKSHIHGFVALPSSSTALRSEYVVTRTRVEARQVLRLRGGGGPGEERPDNSNSGEEKLLAITGREAG